MTIQEAATRPGRRRRARPLPPPPPPKPPLHPQPVYVIPWLEWIKLVGISLSTAQKLEIAGKIKTVRLSKRRKGVRSDHHQEYLAACSTRR
jgi:hypothetical protein